MRFGLRTAALAAFVATGLVTGFVEKAVDVRRARSAPRSTMPDDVVAGARDIEKAWPPGRAGAYVSDDGEWVACGFWQRALETRTVICCRTVDRESVAFFQATRASGLVRWAFGKGVPPESLKLGAGVRRLPSGLWIADLKVAR